MFQDVLILKRITYSIKYTKKSSVKLSFWKFFQLNGILVWGKRGASKAKHFKVKNHPYFFRPRP